MSRLRLWPSRVWFSTLLALLFVACGRASTAVPVATPNTASAAFPRTITDSSGTQVVFRAAPQRIVSLSPGATETLFAIGAGDRVVASDKFSDYPAAAARTPKLDYSQPSAEAVLSYTPDLVIMTTQQQPLVQQFRDLKLPVLYLEEATSLQGVLDNITMLGGLTGHAGDAQTLVTSLRNRMDVVVAAVATVTPTPRVFFEVSPDLYTAAPNTFIGSILTTLRAQNIAQGARTPFPQLSAEAVINANPDVILLSDAQSAKQNVETVSARPGWGDVPAVRNQRIYAVDADITNRPGPRIFDGLEAIARALYPAQFARAGGAS